MNVAVVTPWQAGANREGPRRHIEDYFRYEFPAWPHLIPESDSYPFPISTLCNDAIGQTDADVIVLNWADCLVRPVALAAAVELAATDCGQVKPYSMFLRLSQSASQIASYADVYSRGLHDAELAAPGVGASGIVVVSRRCWDEIGGYDPRFTGWGYHDFPPELMWDAKYGGAPRVDGFCWHLWHEPDLSQADERVQAANVRLYQRYEQHRGDFSGLVAVRREAESETPSEDADRMNAPG